MHVVFSIGFGGAEKLVYDMVLATDSEEFYPVVCCLDTPGNLAEELRDKGYKLYEFSRSPGIDFRLVSSLRQAIRKEKIEVIHAHQYTPYVYAVLASLFLSNIKIIMTEHGRLYPEKRRFKRYLINPLLARVTNHIVSVSQNTKRAMITYDNFPEGKIRVISNGVKLDSKGINIDIVAKRRLLRLDETSAIIGTAARLEEIKNLSMMLWAFRLVLTEMPNTYLVIAGTGSKEAELKDLASRLGILHRVRFIGLRRDLPEIYKLYDIFVLSSYTEGISVTILEAMAAGIPTVVTDVGGNPEVAVEGVTGYIVPICDERAMAARILKLLSDAAKRKAFGQNGAARVRECFSFDHMLGRYFQLYRGE
jgi:glycosyltransferase involved in cell wall biosynthesis